ncbi:MAG: hypothetical protein M1817_000608 [Caeruleum heppii]|nr:MAG: hypothetical protein M1817_000608 [Caeruleum heppii]
MLLEDQRFLHEDLERLEQGIADRALEEPRQVRDHLNRDHQISGFLTRIQDQSRRLLEIYHDADGGRRREIQNVSTGDPFEQFYKQLDDIKNFHRRYPNEPVENLERAYKKKVPGEGDVAASEIDNMFTGEEAHGRFFDLTTLHEDYLNLPGVKRLTYLQYLDAFDAFTPPQCPLKRPEKLTDQYLKYVGRLATYLEDFMRRTKPLEDLDKFFSEIGRDFEKAWEADEIPGWGKDVAAPTVGPHPPSDSDGFWCQDCERDFKNGNVYENHLTGKKHLRAAEARKARLQGGDPIETGRTKGKSGQMHRLKERAIADREYRVRKLASAMQQQLSDTRVNVERKQGMTERERQMELDALFADDVEPTAQTNENNSDSEGDEKIYNPLKLPLAWDGKPIPYWLYKLHGLGVEFSCEICGNFVYMGRRAFDKHFNEARHIYGLKCLGITNTTLFREITGIEDALKLWDKIQRDKKKEKSSTENVVQMEDAEGNVMPEKVYHE